MADQPQQPVAGDGVCRLRGPYLPTGDTEWVCTTHDVEAARIGGPWGTMARRQDMVCPAALEATNQPSAAEAA